MPSVVQFSRRESKPPGEYINSGGPEPATSYRVVMPSMSAVGMAVSSLTSWRLAAVATLRRSDRDAALDLPPCTDVIGVRADRVVRDPSDVGVRVRRAIETGRGVADRRIRHPYPPVQPRAATEHADDGDRHG